MTFRAGHTVRFAVAALGLLTLLVPARGQGPEKSPDIVADRVREVFRVHCAECHGGKQTRADLNVLNASSLFRRERPMVIPRDLNNSELFQLVECGTMPPGTRDKVPAADLQLLREWIAAGAQPFPPEYSEQYALTKILRDVRDAEKDRNRKLTDERYVTLNHLLLASEDTAGDLDRYRAALNKALNQLSTKKDLVTLRPIDPIATIYCIKLSELGWDVQPFSPDPKIPVKDIDPKTVNLYDLLLLDYPLASLLDTSPVGEDIVAEYLAKIKLLRPIPYVYGDWLASVATQAPLYNDMLRLPLSLPELEKRLNFGANVKTERAALTKSAVVGGDRLIERRSSNNGSYWRTYDSASRDDKALLADAAAPVPPNGGAAIFRLTNGLPGYFVADARGVRLDALPAAKQGVGNGLACMICHANGLHKLADAGRYDLPATFPKKAEFDQLLDKDNEGFAEALKETLLGLTKEEPLGPVSRRFRQDMTQRPSHSDITLVNIDGPPKKPSLLDASFKLNYDPSLPVLAHGRLQPPPPLLPIDAVGPARFAGKDAKVKFELTTVEMDGDTPTEKTEKTAFHPGAKMRLKIKNTGSVPLYFEVALTGEKGGIYLFRTVALQPNEVEYAPRLMSKALTPTPPKEGELTKQRFIVYAAPEAFSDGVAMNETAPQPGYSVSGRVVHPFYKIEGKKIVVIYDPSKMVRKTIEFETLVK